VVLWVSECTPFDWVYVVLSPISWLFMPVLGLHHDAENPLTTVHPHNTAYGH